MKSIVFVVFFAMFANWIGHALEYAPYDVIRTTSDFEERFYPARKWVSTSAEAFSIDEVKGKLFWRLFGYISGANVGSVRVPMTAPVTTKIIPGDGPNCNQTFVMSFFIPEEFQDNPPTPTNPEVVIEQRESFPVFSRRFGGFARNQDWIDQAEKLMESLQSANETVVTAPWFTAGYDSPFVIFFRRNEVWFQKEQK